MMRQSLLQYAMWFVRGATIRPAMAESAAGAVTMPTMKIRKVSSGWTKFMGICAILTFLLMVGLLTFQILMWLFFSDQPSVWPAPQ